MLSDDLLSVQPCGKRDRVVMLFIACRVQKRRARVASECGFQADDGFRIGIKFAIIAAGEFLPFRRVMTKPASQTVARCNVFDPEIDAGLILVQPAWPEPIDKDTKPILLGGRGVGAFDGESGRHEGT